MSLELTPLGSGDARREPVGTAAAHPRRSARLPSLPRVDVLQGTRRMLVASSRADGRLRLGARREGRGGTHRRRPLPAR